jgi:hypothetical protein
MTVTGSAGSKPFFSKIVPSDRVPTYLTASQAKFTSVASLDSSLRQEYEDVQQRLITEYLTVTYLLQWIRHWASRNFPLSL